MARRQNDDLLIEDELAAAFLNDDQFEDEVLQADIQQEQAYPEVDPEDEFPGQLAVDVYETDDKLVVKARTAGVNKQDLDVSLSDNILTISGTLNSGDQYNDQDKKWHSQECYWGEFSRTVALPVQIKEDEVEAILKDGVLIITFTKVRQEPAKKIQVL